MENLLGNEYGGWHMAMSTVDWDRSAACAPAVGNARFILDQCAKYANDRVAFGKPIGKFQAIQHKIADMKVYLEIAKLAVYRVAWAKDNGIMLDPLKSAVNKLYLSDQALEIHSQAVQVFGGYGYMHEYPVERMFRDARLGPIGGGTSEVMRLIISRMILGE